MGKWEATATATLGLWPHGEARETNLLGLTAVAISKLQLNLGLNNRIFFIGQLVTSTPALFCAPRQNTT
jgi:hypothetical protein